MQNSNADNLSELRNMKQELTDANQMIDNLEEKLNLKELRDEEIEKLKTKAQEFEEYIRSHTTRSGSVASSLTNTSLMKADVSTETSDLNDDDVSRKMRQMESKARDEMAKIFAGEVKTTEKKFREEIERLNNRIILITEDLEETSHELCVRKEQMELLKFTILKEREEAENLLNEKDNDFKVAIEKYRIEYENNQQKVEELMSQLNEKRELIDEERLSIESLKRQMNEERVSLAKREEETAHKLKKLQLESSKITEELNEKYLSAKKTALNYKQYSEDKENHFRNECERMKKLYREAAENMHKKLEQRWKESVSEKDKSYQERITTLEKEYDFKLQMLKDLLEKKN
jgi:centrosomal protein CEP152